jgi:hypothetical protein
MFEFLNRIPLVWAKIITLAGFLGMIIWIWIRPKAFILAGSTDRQWWRDLRIWASLAMGCQIVLYALFR